MAAIATVRHLRNRFPQVRQMVEAEGEVLVTDHGVPRYRLTRYVPTRPDKVAAKDYLARLRRHQPHPLSATESTAVHEANRGDR